MFDVNETLLDLSPLSEPFAKAYGRPDAMKTWFSTLLHYSSIATLTDDYHPFGELGLAACEALARQWDVNVGEDQRRALVELVLALPAHPDGVDALQRLMDAGFRMVTLTNSAPPAAETQLERAGLRHLFERVYTVEMVKLFKPHRRTYEAVAANLGVATSDLRMIAAHGWDVAGAMAAGCSAAFVARPGQALYPLAPRPGIVGKDLDEVANAIINAEIHSSRD